MSALTVKNLKIAKLINALQPSVVDAGARGGLDEDLVAIAWACSVYAFEADPAEAMRLRQLPHAPWKHVTVFPCAVGGISGMATLFVPESNAAASLVRHNPAMVARFGYHNLHITRQELEVDVTTLDTLFSTGNLTSVDYLKLDIEGAELDVLKAARSLLGNCSAVKVECSFLAQRTSQAIIWDVIAFLETAGFEIVDMQDIHRWRRRPVPAHPYVINYPMPYSRGQVAQCDVLALRRGETIDVLRQKTMLVAISSALGYFDYAMSVVRETPSVATSTRETYGFEIEQELANWARIAGARHLRIAILAQLRGLLPQFRSFMRRLPYQSPIVPY